MLFLFNITEQNAFNLVLCIILAVYLQAVNKLYQLFLIKEKYDSSAQISVSVSQRSE